MYAQFKIEFLIHKMRIYLLKIVFSNKTVEFRCSKKMLPSDLEDIAKDFRLKTVISYPYPFISKDNLYFKGYLSYENKNWGFTDLKEQNLTYCNAKAKIIQEFMEKLRKTIIQDQKIDILGVLSSSSLSLKIFKKNFNKNMISLQTKQTLDSLIREGYFGGRVEVFGNTERRVYHYDFPGMYGICMKEKFPHGEVKILLGHQLDINALDPGFYTIQWNSPNLKIPILPIKNEFGKLVFLNGTHSGTYWFEEINLFIKHGGQVLKIERAVIYKSYDYIFDDFVEYFNTYRKKGGVYKILGKLIINSLYGKMGSGIKNTEYQIAKTEQELNEIATKQDIIRIDELNTIFIIEVRSKTKKKGINVGLAAAVTAKARVRLVNAMINIEKNGGRMLYCDTDSLFIEFKGKVDNSLSNWKEENSVYDEAIFALPKTYALRKGDKTITRIKGIPKSSINFDLFKDKFINGDYLTFSDIFQIKKSEFRITSQKGDKKINLAVQDRKKILI